jgi:hypothetical protein
MKKNCYLVNYPCMPREHLLASWEKNERSKPFVELTRGIINSGYNCIICDNGWDGADIENEGAIIVLNSDLTDELLHNLSKIPKNRCFLVILEPPNMDRFVPHYDPKLKEIFGTILMMFDELLDNETYMKLYHWQACSVVVPENILFRQKKFCTMVQMNRSSDHPNTLFYERRAVAEYLGKDPQFDLYGPGWDGYKAWRGELPTDKLDTLKNYKFTISYENTRDRPGFITERIFEALYAKCVPIYWGTPDIEKYVPQEAFINRMHFPTNKKLYAFLKEMDEKTYNSYIQAGQEYLQTPYVKEHYALDSFAKSILKRVEERAG